MDNAGRHTLKALKSTIKEKLYLADKIMDLLEEKDTIDEEISQKIKAEKTNEERIDKLLYYLKRRGPNAFGHFMEAVKTDPVNETLVQALQTEYQRALRTDDNQGITSRDRNKEEIPRNFNPNNLSSLPQTPSSDSLGSKLGEFRGQPYPQHELSTLYTRLKDHMTSLNLRELSFTTPKPEISLQMVAELVDHYLGVVEECYEALGIRERTKPLKSHIVDLKACIKQLKGEIKEHDKQRNKLSHHYIKLENKHRETNRELENKHKETKKKLEDTLAKNHELNLKIHELEAALNNTRSALKEKIEEISQLEQRQVPDGQTVRTQENPSSMWDTNVADSIANSPSRNPKNAEKRAKRKNSIGVNSPSRRKPTYVSPRRSSNQSAANEEGIVSDRQRVNMPFVFFHENTKDGAITNGGSSQGTHFVICNTATKVPQMNADCTPDNSETQKETRKNKWSRFKNGKK